MTSTIFLNATLTYLFKGKRKNIVDDFTHIFDMSESQVWLTQDRLLLNTLFHLITGNVQPTRGKIINPIRNYYAIKPIPILNHFSLLQYLKTVLSVMAPKQVNYKEMLRLICEYHQFKKSDLHSIVEYFAIETQIAISLTIAILLDLRFIFIQNSYINKVLMLLPQVLHEQWDGFLKKNTVISVCYNQGNPLINPDFTKIITLYPHEVRTMINETVS